MKLLVLLNENPAGAHDDVHRAIKNCKEKGIITDNYIYPFLTKLAEGEKEKDVLKEIVEISKNYQPDLILWMHTDRFKVNQDAINELKSLKSKPVMGYWDGDIYPELFIPVPKAVLELSSACDVVFVQGFGEMSKKMQAKGCNDIRLVPAFADEKRFYPIKTNQKEYDIVMIGNYTLSRNPFRITLPGTQFRKVIVKTLSEKYEAKFAVYGNNWSGSSAKGVIPYLDQHNIYSKSKITISINNDNAKYYFSDRLPIAMLSGIPVVQSYEEGFDKLFYGCGEIRFYKSLQEALEQCEALLKKSDDELNEIGKKLLEYALKNFSVKLAFHYMINVLIEKYSLKNISNSHIYIKNPWLEDRSK